MGKPIQATPLPRIAATYARVSTLAQDGGDKTSLDTQEAGARAWALSHDWHLDERFAFREKHTGEELWERPELTRLRELARGRHFGVLVCHSIDRLSRDPIHLGIVLDELARLGIAVEFVTEELDDSPEAALVRYIKGYAGKVENERRKERTMRAKLARATAGKLIPSSRPLYGYQWANDRKESLVPDPITAPIVARMYTLALEGRTLRAIAAILTAEGIPTPTGRHAAWDGNTIRWILQHPTYCGQPAALRYQDIPVEKHLRQQYARKSRSVPRPADEQIPLPASVAPALVSVEVAEQVQRRLRLNKLQATRNNRHPELSLLRGGFLHCAYCGRVMAVWTTTAGRGSTATRTRYMCHASGRPERTCPPHTIAAHKIDTAVWAKLCEILRTPELIEQEVRRLREVDDPGAPALDVIDTQIADLDRRIRNKRKYAEAVDDDREREEVAAEVKQLIVQRTAAEAARAEATRHYANWQEQREGLVRALDWCARVAGNLDTFTYDEKRFLLTTLRVDVRLYRVGHEPRAELIIHLPISGAHVLAVNCDKSTVAALR